MKLMLNRLLFALGLLGFVVGVVFTPTPVPGTTLLIILTLGLMIHTSPRTEQGIRWLRSKYKYLNQGFLYFEKLSGRGRKWIGETLKKTRPK